MECCANPPSWLQCRWCGCCTDSLGHLGCEKHCDTQALYPPSYQGQLSSPKDPDLQTTAEEQEAVSTLGKRNPIFPPREVTEWCSQLYIISFRPWLISYPTWEWEATGTDIFIFTAHYIMLGWWYVLTTVIPTHDYTENRTEIEIFVGCLGVSLKSPEQENTAHEHWGQSSNSKGAPETEIFLAIRWKHQKAFLFNPREGKGGEGEQLAIYPILSHSVPLKLGEYAKSTQNL